MGFIIRPRFLSVKFFCDYSSSGLRVGDESLQIRVAAFSAIIKPGVSHDGRSVWEKKRRYRQPIGIAEIFRREADTVSGSLCRHLPCDIQIVASRNFSFV